MSLIPREKHAMLIKQRDQIEKEKVGIREEMMAVAKRVVGMNTGTLRAGFVHIHSLRFLPTMYEAYLWSLVGRLPCEMTLNELALFYIERCSNLHSYFSSEVKCVETFRYDHVSCTGFIDEKTGDVMCRFEIH